MIFGGTGLAATLALLLFTDVLAAVYSALGHAPTIAVVFVALPLTSVLSYGLLVFYGFRLKGLIARTDSAHAAADFRAIRVACASLLVVSLVAAAFASVLLARLILPVTAASVGSFAAATVLLLRLHRTEREAALARGGTAPPDGGRGFQVVMAPFAIQQVVPIAAPASPSCPTLDGTPEWRPWERVVYGLALLAIILHLGPATLFVGGLEDYVKPGFWNQAFGTAYAGSGWLTPGMLTEYRLSGAVVAAHAVSGLFAVGWLLWGLVCLVLGPRLRLTAVILAWAALAAAALPTGIALYRHDRLQSALYEQEQRRRSWTYSTTGPHHLFRPSGMPWLLGPDPRGVGDPGVAALTGVGPGVAFPVILLLLVNCPPLRQLFRHRFRRP